MFLCKRWEFAQFTVTPLLEPNGAIATMSLASHQGLVGVLEERRSELRRFFVARTGNEADADDLLSQLWIKINDVRPGPLANPAAYLFRMANNLVLDRLRAERRRQRRESDWTVDHYGPHAASMEVADRTPTAEQQLVEGEEAERLANAIAQLPAGAQRVLRMHKLDGLSHGEVAAELGISKSAVEKHMAVAMAHLRRLMGD